MEITTIRISKETADRLVRRKTYGLSYDDVIKKLLDLDDLVTRESIGLTEVMDNKSK